MEIADGKYLGKGVSYELGTSSTGTEQVAVSFRIQDHQGKETFITWYGFFTDATYERTIESLRIMGWKGTDISDLTGYDENEVELVVESEEYEGKIRPKVRWVNRVGGGAALKNVMTPEQKKVFAAKMKGKVLAFDQKAGAPKNTGRPPAKSNGGALPPEPPPIANQADDFPNF